MARLILLHDAGVSGEFELRPGVNTLGRAPDNDLSIEHESISEHHCQIELTPGGIVVRDLGSTCGTWIDAVQVQEGRLDPGQTLQLGDIQFALQAPVRVSVSPAGTADRPGDAAAGRLVYCGSCDRWWPASEAREQRVGMSLVRFCPQCAGPCAAAPRPGRNDPAAGAPAPATFRQSVGSAFGYPFRESGVWMLLSGALALTITHYAAWLSSYAPLLGLVALLFLTVGVAGYFFAFIKEVVAASAAGTATLPGWPEVTSPSDFLTPFLQFLALLVVSFGPLVLWALWGPESGGAWVHWGLAAWGSLYWPMALVGLALADSVAGLNPAVILPSILRIFGQYLAAVVLVGLLLGLQYFSGWLAEAVPIPVVTTFLVQFLTLYFLVVTARILGMLYYLRREDLGWFKPSAQARRP